MSDDLTPSGDATPEPVAEPTPPPEPPPVDDDAAIEANAIDIPDGDRLVPLSVVAPLREKVRTLKPEAERAKQLEAELAQLREQTEKTKPVVEAARAIVEQMQRQAVPPPAPPPEDTGELEAIARDLDLYRPDGTPDVDRARRIREREVATAKRMADEATAPIRIESLRDKAIYNLERAKHTADASGRKPDPKVLDAYWDHLSRQPGGLDLLANPQNARHVWNQAYTDTFASQTSPTAHLPKVEPPPPVLHTETPGGKASALPTLTATDRRTAKDLGISEAEYAKTLAAMPAGWGKR